MISSLASSTVSNGSGANASPKPSTPSKPRRTCAKKWQATIRRYCKALSAVVKSAVPFLVGGGYALECYTGLGRPARDFDLFVRRRDIRALLDALAGEAKKQEIAFEGHVPDSVRASEMSEAGMRSFEHLIGIFEGSSSAEDDFLKGNKTEGRFLAAYDSARAASLASILAKNQTWQCPTLVWERGGNLIDASDFSKDTRVKYVPGSWRTKTWKRFTMADTPNYPDTNPTMFVDSRGRLFLLPLQLARRRRRRARRHRQVGDLVHVQE